MEGSPDTCHGTAEPLRENLDLNTASDPRMSATEVHQCYSEAQEKVYFRLCTALDLRMGCHRI